jgi:Fe-S-cluster containining protein
MEFDFTPFFKRYEALVQVVDQVFEQMAKEFPDAVVCKPGCTDCCHAIFDLTLIEALYLNEKFNMAYHGPEREALLELANKVDRRLAKIKRSAFQKVREGQDEREILSELARERIRCPLLGADERCRLYDHRPLSCRLDGIPTSIGGRGSTCARSNFTPGRKYPTVNRDLILQQLQQITTEMIRKIGSPHIKLADLLVPLSMALLTLYDDEYFGLDAKSRSRGANR